jgi:4-alpha-glucanotransferase
MPWVSPASFLHRLAEQYGIQTAYLDALGQRRQASPEALLRVLQVLGSHVSRAGEARQALRERRQECWRRVLEPAHVAWRGEPAAVRLRLPVRQSRSLMSGRLCMEDGTERSWSCQLADLLETERTRVEHITYVAREVTLPEDLPPGYHQLTLEMDGTAFQTLILSAPRRAYVGPTQEPGRAWGVFLPLYALQTQHSWGCGDFSDLETLLAWTGRLGGGVVGTLPLLAAFLDEPCEASPYSPVSRLFWNELYLDVSRAPELESCPEARALMRSEDFVAELLVLRDAPLVDYRRTMALKRRILSELVRSFFQGSSERRAVFAQFLRAQPQVEDYAAFRAVQERRRTPWTEWPAPLRDGTVADDDFDPQVHQYHLYVQWLAAEQMAAVADKARALGPGMYLDLPLGVHAHGYDVWRERPAFAAGVSGGAPPDVVFPRGQNWGFAPLHPEGIRAQGYRYVRAFVRRQMDLAGILRIDHMPSFHRVFWVPDGMEAKDGVFVRYPAEELYALFSLESHRHRTVLVGEDLGTVPPEVRLAMKQHGFQRMYVVQYELKPAPEVALPEAQADSVASVNTHDMPPFAAYWEGQDVQQRLDLHLLDEAAYQRERSLRQAVREALISLLRERGLLSEAEDARAVLHACLRFLAEGPSQLVLVSLEDLWLETRPQNVPSTWQEYPNWRRKARFTLEEMERLPEAGAVLAEVDRSVRGARHLAEQGWNGPPTPALAADAQALADSDQGARSPS